MIISIHAPREGSDETSSKQISQTAQFLSTLPARGATGTASCVSLKNVLFLSTLPARGATPGS